MASFPDLRPTARLAKAECRAALSFGSLAVLASAHARVAVVSTFAFVAVSELATLRGQKALTTPSVPARTLCSRAMFLAGTSVREARSR